MIEMTSGWLTWSAERTVAMTWTSLRKPSANDERMRAVDHAGGEGGLLGRARLTLDEAAGELARGVHALFEVDREREEVQVLGLLATRSR